jgi:serine/threonine protein kinase
MCDVAALPDLLAEWEKRFDQGQDVPAAELGRELCPDCPTLIDHLGAEIAKLKKWKTPSTLGPTDAITVEGLAAPGSKDVPKAAFAGQRYEPLEHLASGGLGDVFIAEDKELGRKVALKRIQPPKAKMAESREQFRLEGEITGHLEHPGVVPVYGRGADGEGQPFYTMRFIQGESLRQAIERLYSGPTTERADEPPPTLRQLVSRFTAACYAVAYAHNRGVVHRDIKPGNIMLGKYGETLVVDWGLARRVERRAVDKESSEFSVPLRADRNSGWERKHHAIGTVGYMSPEQAQGDWDNVGPLSDIFSLGATLYAVLTGRPAYQGEWALLAAQRGDYRLPQQVRPDVPAPLAAICVKAMAKKPADRYVTALQMAHDLEAWLADEPVSAYRETGLVRFRRRLRHNPRLAITVTAVVFMGVAALAFALGLALR